MKVINQENQPAMVLSDKPDWREGLNPNLVKDVERAVKYPTPRSDKAIQKCAAKQSGADMVVGEFARVLERELAESQESNRFATHILQNFVNQLPSRRDWLDPDLERMAKRFLDEQKRRAQEAELK